MAQNTGSDGVMDIRPAAALAVAGRRHTQFLIGRFVKTAGSTITGLVESSGNGSAAAQFRFQRFKPPLIGILPGRHPHLPLEHPLQVVRADIKPFPQISQGRRSFSVVGVDQIYCFGHQIAGTRYRILFCHYTIHDAHKID